MQRKKLLAIILLIVILAVALYIALNQPSVIRSKEANALNAAENTNYTKIFNLSRFKDFGGSPSDNKNSYTEYTFASFIDSEVIKYYHSRYESLKGIPKDLNFDYNANVFFLEKMQAVYDPSPENETNYKSAVRILSSNGTTLSENSRHALYAYTNNSRIIEIQASDVNFEFSNCYIVQMRLTYVEMYGMTSGFLSIVNQTVIEDENFKPVFICVNVSNAIS